MISNFIYLVGSPGTGKTYSIKHLPTTETHLLAFIHTKALSRRLEKLYTKENKNYFRPSNVEQLESYLKYFRDLEVKPKYVIFDDIHILTSEDIFNSSNDNNFNKYAIIAKNLYKTFNLIKNCAADFPGTQFILTWHDEIDDQGRRNIKVHSKQIEKLFHPAGLTDFIFYTKLGWDAVGNPDYKFQVRGTRDIAARCLDDYFAPDIYEVPNDIYYITKYFERSAEEDYSYNYEKYQEELEAIASAKNNKKSVK